MKKLNTNFVGAILVTVIVLVIIFTVLADVGLDLGSAAGNASELPNETTGACPSGNCPGGTFPLTSFLKRKGIVLLAMMAGIVITLISILMKKGK